MRNLPKLPVLGWAAYSGDYDPPFAGVLDAPHCRYTISGRAAISLALHVIGAVPGNKVLVPTYHCPTMIAPIGHSDLQPMFYPVTVEGAPDLTWLGRVDLTGVRAMLAAHYFGLPQPMSAIRAFCDTHGIALIEDCAHAFFGVSDGRPVGTWGDCAIASLTKFFPVPEGGLIVSSTRPLDMLYLTPRSLQDQVKAALDAVEIGVQHDRFPGLNSLLGFLFGVKKWIRRHNNSNDARALSPGEDLWQARLLFFMQPASAVRWITGGVHRAR